MEPKEMPMGEHLYSLRKSRGLSQSEVAEALDVSRQTVTRWESGEVVPSVESWRKLSQLYGIPVEALMTGTAEPYQPKPGAPSEPAPPAQERPADRRRERRWKLIAVCALLALAVVSAALVREVRKDQPGENKSTVSRVKVESVESVPTITFDAEEW